LDISSGIIERKKMMQYKRMCHLCAGKEKKKEKGKELHHHYSQTEQVDV